jgi:hypothetical protein
VIHDTPRIGKRGKTVARVLAFDITVTSAKKPCPCEKTSIRIEFIQTLVMDNGKANWKKSGIKAPP